MIAEITLEERKLISSGDWNQIAKVFSDVYQRGDLIFENE